jgi:precorrin-6A synthase
MDVRRLSIIGIGAGDPDYVTVQAIKALNEADVFFVVTKASEQQDLVDLRMEILERYVEEPSYRLVEVEDPERRRGAPTASYRSAVEDWRRQRADRYERLIRDELGETECGAFLVWGDPSLYDSTLGVIDDILARGAVAFEHRVIPGISSVQALAAQHRIVLNRVGGAVQVTTGRRLSAGFPSEADDVVVMLDPHCTFTEVEDEGVEIYWGAYVGTDDEILVSGRLADVRDDIERVRAEAKERKGWMFDTYLLRRPPAP